MPDRHGLLRRFPVARRPAGPPDPGFQQRIPSYSTKQNKNDRAFMVVLCSFWTDVRIISDGRSNNDSSRASRYPDPK
jgi:hypothetical protein